MLGEILKNRKVLAVSGTHGKTTTSYMLAHIFLNQGRDIGFLVGGVSEDIKGSASLGTDNIFVIEADEYDSAFFDKRSKFIHYSPSTLVINNIEFDHADIFDHLDDIKRQFHHLIKIIPSSGEVIYFSDDKNSEDVISKGLWCKSTVINDNEIKISFEEQELEYKGIAYSLAGLPLIGLHNFKNYIAAILAAKTDDIAINDSIESLKSFNGVKRRLEYKGKFSNIHLYDDFAHHPTAIMFSSQAIRMKYPEKKILGLIELGSNTMSGGSHGLELLDTVACLDNAVWLDHKNVLSDGNNITSSDNIEDFINQTKLILSEYDIILLMTNKDSYKILKPLISYLEKK
jgi:UDP-N-acetylmuramate: L-alanyl-gamma-D-glutamyl-meso-diaminopimelate ligase